MQLTTIELLQTIPVIAILLYAAYKDHTTGQVTNKAWLYTPIGTAITLLVCYYYPNYVLAATLNIFLAASLALLLFYMGMWEGADAKALILIALATPQTPIWNTLVPLSFQQRTPFITLILTGIVAIIYTIAKKPKQTKLWPYLKTAKIRYLPFLLVGYILTIILI